VKPEAMNRLTKLAKAATILFSSKMTALSLYDANIDGDWSNVFTGNRSKLKIEKVSNLDLTSTSLLFLQVSPGRIMGGVIRIPH
jgi:hypothetical protein